MPKWPLSPKEKANLFEIFELSPNFQGLGPRPRESFYNLLKGLGL